MVYVGAAAAVVGLLLTVVNLAKSSSDWFRDRKVQRIAEKQRVVEEQVAAWRDIVDDLTRHNEWLEGRLNRAEERVKVVEDRQEECEKERDQLLIRLQQVASGRRKL